MKPGSPTKPVPGYDVRILRETGEEADRGETGAIAIRLPLPPGCAADAVERRRALRPSYLEQFPGYYVTGDGGYVDDDGYLFVMGRIDDVINVAGHRLSTGAMEEVLATHADVAECAVIGVPDELQGRGAVRLRRAEGRRRPRPPTRSCASSCSSSASRSAPSRSFRDARVVARLPKTRSGKILRGTMRAIASGSEYTVPSTIDDPAILEEIATALS